jgi:hypothetical protein
MDIPNQEEQYWESFSAFFTRASFRTDQTRQTALCSDSQTTRMCPVHNCGALCPQINNSKLHILRQFSKGKLKAMKKLYVG